MISQGDEWSSSRAVTPAHSAHDRLRPGRRPKPFTIFVVRPTAGIGPNLKLKLTQHYVPALRASTSSFDPPPAAARTGGVARHPALPIEKSRYATVSHDDFQPASNDDAKEEGGRKRDD
jgi:hypothetical protein